MVASASFPAPRGLALMFGWRRLLLVLVVATLLGLLLSPAFPTTPNSVMIGNTLLRPDIEPRSLGSKKLIETLDQALTHHFSVPDHGYLLRQLAQPELARVPRPLEH